MFLALAVVLHLALLRPLSVEGVAASGGGATGAVALEGATPDLAALVAAWETEPAVSHAASSQRDEPAAEDPPILEMASDPRVEPRPTAEPLRPAEVQPRPVALPTPPAMDARSLPDMPPAPQAIAASPEIARAAAVAVARAVPAELTPDRSEPDSPAARPAQPEPEPLQPAIEASPIPEARPIEPEITRPETPRRVAPKPPASEARQSARAEPASRSAVRSDAAASDPGGASSPAASEGAPGPAPTAALSEADRVSLLHAYGAEILAAIARERRYPHAARMRGAEGVARMTVIVDRAGGLVAARVETSSGHRALDDAAVAAARAVRRFPEPPDALAGERFSFTIPMRFSMR